MSECLAADRASLIFLRADFTLYCSKNRDACVDLITKNTQVKSFGPGNLINGLVSMRESSKLG